MTLVIPNSTDAAFAPQAQPDSEDFEILSNAHAFTGVTTGCAVTTTGTTNGSVSVAAGTVQINGVMVTVPSTTVAIAANSSGNPRFDLITVPTGGTPIRTAGTAGAAPAFPSIPASSVVLAAIYVPNGHTTGTNIPANTITDKRVIVQPYLYENTVAQWNLLMDDPAKVGLRIKGVDDPSNFVKPLFQVDDKNDAPIMWVQPVGGMFVNDDLGTAYTVFGPEKFKADVYGFMWRNNQISFSFAGPPGNMLSWTDAVHEVYQATRLATVGSWGVVAACTIATFDFGSPPTGSPTTYRSGLRITNTTGGTAWISTPGSTSAYSGVTPGDIVAAVYNIRSNTASAARNAQVRITWLTSAGATVGSDITSGTFSVPNNGTWTKVYLDGQVAPATAARVQISILVQSANTEKHDIAGVGLMRGSVSNPVFAPPFVAYNPTTETAFGAQAGDRWIRTDTPTVPGQREYICTTGGEPYQQYWQPLDTATVQRVVTDQVNNTTSAATITAFSFPVLANAQYLFDYDIWLTSAATTTGWNFGFTGPSSPTHFAATIEYQSSATAWSTQTIQSFTTGTLVTAAYAAAPTLIRVRIQAVLQNGANAGTVNLQFLSEVASSAITIKRGSKLSVT